MLIGASTSSPLLHVALEAAAYSAGALVYRVASRNQPAPGSADRWFLITAAILGALVGSKLLHVLEHLPELVARGEPELWMGGKSLLGGLLAGTLAVEWAKRLINWTIPTGDPWVPALAVGITIGRCGCQLSGFWDHTYGVPTGSAWGWDYGDGVARHPVALYEVVWVVVTCVVVRRRSILARRGAGFAAFLLSYCVARLTLDFLKPPFGAAGPDTLPVATWWGLTAIQWAAVAGSVGCAHLLRQRWRVR